MQHLHMIKTFFCPRKQKNIITLIIRILSFQNHDFDLINQFNITEQNSSYIPTLYLPLQMGLRNTKLLIILTLCQQFMSTISIYFLPFSANLTQFQLDSWSSQSPSGASVGLCFKNHSLKIGFTQSLKPSSDSIVHLTVTLNKSIRKITSYKYNYNAKWFLRVLYIFQF